MKNDSLYYPLIDETIRFVKVRFMSHERGEHSGKTYTYKTDLLLAVKDVVVCEVYNWYAVGIVQEVDVPMPLNDNSTNYRWIVDRIATESHDERLQFERDLIKQINETRTRNIRSAVLEQMGLTEEVVTLIVNKLADTPSQPVRDVYEEAEVEEVYDDTQDYGELPVDDRHGFSHNDNN